MKNISKNNKRFRYLSTFFITFITLIISVNFSGHNAYGSVPTIAEKKSVSNNFTLQINSCSINCIHVIFDLQTIQGKKDAWQSIQNALDTTAKNTTVVLPAGVFRLSHPLKVPSNVILSGKSMDTTTLLLDRRFWKNFGNSFMITPQQTKNVLSSNSQIVNMTLDGNRIPYDAVGRKSFPKVDQGGGIKLGNYWRVKNVRLSNFNYFRIWGKNITNSIVSETKFEDIGNGRSSGNDNIGGGNIKNTTFINNYFASTSKGNAVDIVKGQNIVIKNNIIIGEKNNPHNIYFEGVTNSLIEANTLLYSNISVQSNKGYHNLQQIVNPTKNSIINNVIKFPTVQGISLRYDTSTNMVKAIAGGNNIVGNKVENSGTAGIIVFAEKNNLTHISDIISNNTIVDPFMRGSSSWNCGYGITYATGIVIGAGKGSIIENNMIVDTHEHSNTMYAVQIGIQSSRQVETTVASVKGNVGVNLSTDVIVFETK